MPNTELPIDIEQQFVLMKKYVNFRQKKKMREFLGYAGYFRASRYGKYLLTQVNKFGSKADENLKTSPCSQNILNALAVNEPLEYAKLVLGGKIQVWMDSIDSLDVW